MKNFLETVKRAQNSQQSSEITRLKSRLAEAKKRVQELEKLICRIYEDNILGKLPDERYAILDGQYSKEQKDLSAEIADMEAELSGYEEGRRSVEKFIALVDKYQNFVELTTYMLNEFVEKIVVHERDRKGSIETTQEVEIYFNFIIPPKITSAIPKTPIITPKIFFIMYLSVNSNLPMIEIHLLVYT